MSPITVDISETLINELRAWAGPRDKFAPVGGLAGPPLKPCYDMKSCHVCPDKYKQSLQSLMTLKSIRHMVSSLATVIDEGITSMEAEILPLTRSYGAFSLPSEIVVRIMDFVGGWASSDSEVFKETMHTFLDAPPFDAYVKDARALRKKWRELNLSWTGGLPPRAQRIPVAALTSFHLSVDNALTLRELQDGFALFKSLRELKISCTFSHTKITEGEDLDGAVTLPSLLHLSVSNLSSKARYGMTAHGWKAFEPLRRIIRMLSMPHVKHITAHIYSDELPGPEPPVILALDKVFSFPHRLYPRVTTFEIKDYLMDNLSAWASVDLSNAFRSLPALVNLTLGTCHTREYKCDDHNCPTSVRSMQFEFGKELSADESLLNVGGLRVLLRNKEKDLERVTIVAEYEEVYDQMCEYFKGAEWVTEKSILDLPYDYAIF